MTLTLSPQMQARLTSAALQDGVAIDDVVERLVAENLPPVRDEPPAVSAKNQALIDLLNIWTAEDATDDEDELAQRDAENREFFDNLKANPITLKVPEV